jgi:hypothetical protein
VNDDQLNRVEELANIRRQLAQARRELAAAAVEYASTPDGAAETYRRYELASVGNERDTLRATYLAGLAMAAQEYEDRRARGSASDRDGYLQALPVGSFENPIARALVAHRVMATYRSGPVAMNTGAVSVHLLRLLPDETTRRRARLTASAELGTVAVSLADIVADAWEAETTRARLADFLGRSALDDVQAAVSARGRRAVAR